jgi:hypothetical protein
LDLIVQEEEIKKVTLHNSVPEFDLIYEVSLEKEEKNEKGSIKRPNRTTGKMGCTAFINVRVDKKSSGDPWMIKSICFEHNHPISEDERLYSVNRKLDAENQELVINLMRSGTLPREALKVSLNISFNGLLCCWRLF